MPKPLRVRAALAVLAVLASTAVIAIATAPVAEAATVVNLAPLVISSKGDFNSYCVTASTDGRTTSAEGCPDSIPVGMWFVPKPASSGVQLSVASNPTRCLSVPNSSMSSGVRLVQEPCTGAARMVWSIDHVTDIYYRLINVNSRSCLAHDGVQRTVVQGSCEERWHLSPVGTIKFRALHSGKCLDVDDSGGTAVSGALAQQWTCLGAGATNQQFSLELVRLPRTVGGGCTLCTATIYPAHYRLVATHSGMCLAHNNKTSNGTRIRQRPCDSQPDLWSLYPMEFSSGREVFRIKQQVTVGSQPGTCVDVDNTVDGTRDGEKVQIYDCLDGQTNQLWSLFQVTEV